MKKILSILVLLSFSQVVMAQPANNTCASPSALTAATVSTTASATTSGTDPYPICCWDRFHTVWFTYTTGASGGSLTLNLTHGTIRYAGIALFSGTCASLTELGCSEPGTSTGNPSLTVNCLSASTTYYIMVYDDNLGSAGTGGTYTLTPTFVAGSTPANDACTSATNLGTAFTSTTVTGSNTCASVDNDVANCFSASNNVWYKFTTGTGAGYVATFTLNTGTLTYPVLSIFSGSCGAFVGVACSDPFTSAGPVTATASCLTPNTTYYVEVDDDFGTAGTFTLITKLTAGSSGPPSNDDCTGATNLGTAFTTTTTTGDNTCASADNDVGSCLTANKNVWYKFTTGASAGYVATFTVTSGTLKYPVLDVFSGTCATLSEMAGACTNPGTSGSITATVSCLAPNTTYYVEVDDDDFSGTAGTFTLTTHLASGTGVPTNDNCTSATNLGTAFTSTTVAGTNVCASYDNDVASCFSASNNVWYKFTTGASFTKATFTVTAGTLTYPVLDVFSGSCGAFTEVVCSNPFTSGGPVTATASCLSPNTTYYVEVDDDFGTAGTFSLTVKLTTASVTCTGTPSGGTISPTSNTLACLPQSQSFSLSGQSTGCGVTYQWQTSSDNTTWTNVTGETNSTYTAASISSTTYVKCVVTCNGTTSSSSTTSTITVSSSPGVNGSSTCASAPVVTNGVGCGDNTTAATTDPGYWPSVSQFSCDGSIDNLIFEQFQTDNVGGTVNLIVSNIACVSGEGVQAALFDPTTTCSASGWGTALFCHNGSDLTTYTMTMTGLLANHTYWLVYDGYAGAQCTWGTSLTGDVLLPLDIIYFNGAMKDGKVDLQWSTASETNNDYFTIEKSPDGTHFEELIRIKGAGNSAQKIDYKTTDNLPYKGTSYYRLSQTDFNGTHRDYFIIPITNTLDDGMFKVVPNPTDGNIQITYACEDTEASVLKIYNSTGNLVLTQGIKCNAGENKMQIDLSEVKTGIYFITFSTASKFYTSKLFKK